MAPDNVFWQMQEAFSHWLEISLDAYGKVRDAASESLFHTVYGSPLLQASVGLGPSHDNWRTAKDPVHLSAVAERIKSMSDQIEKGGAREAIIRSLIYVRMPDGVVDERGFNFLQRLRDETGHGLSLRLQTHTARAVLHAFDRRASRRRSDQRHARLRAATRDLTDGCLFSSGR